MACKCSLCKHADYNPSDYEITAEDIKALSQLRKKGISGHLRVKNEEATIQQCIESVLPALDELIITYQPSSDATEQILTVMAEKYPEKIRLFPYLPHVISAHTTNDFPDSTSIHNLANYYNYGYTKISYEYYMKVDADQIYFTEKLQNILSEILEHSMNCTSSLAFALGGINILLHKNKLYIPLSIPLPTDSPSLITSLYTWIKKVLTPPPHTLPQLYRFLPLME